MWFLSSNQEATAQEKKKGKDATWENDWEGGLEKTFGRWYVKRCFKEEED